MLYRARPMSAQSAGHEVPHIHELNSNDGTFLPEEVGGKADEKQKDGDGEILEVRRVAEGEVNSIADDGGGDKNKDEGCPRIAGNAIGNGVACRGAANGENGGGSETVEDPPDKDHAADQAAERAQLTGTNQNYRPYTKSDNRGCWRLEPWMDFREFPEKKLVIGHCVENPRGGEDHAVGRAEGGNEDGERHDAARPVPEDRGNRRGSYSVAGGHVLGTERE